MKDRDIKTVIFDMDGVIVNSEPVYDQLLSYWYRDHGIEATSKVREDTLGFSWEQVFEYANENFDIKIDPAQESDAMAQTIVKHIEDTGIPLQEGSIQAIEKLSELYTLALVSSSPRVVVERILKHIGVYKYFTHITTIEDVEHPKPHPQPYAITMAVLGTAPEETVVIEDSLRGAQSAAASGAFVYVNPDPRIPAEKFVTLAKVIYSFDDLLKDLV
ncbi:MAG: HAD family phosphatase [bacterium]|nr:HAD family phosphatase [bacterium]